MSHKWNEMWFGFRKGLVAEWQTIWCHPHCHSNPLIKSVKVENRSRFVTFEIWNWTHSFDNDNWADWLVVGDNDKECCGGWKEGKGYDYTLFLPLLFLKTAFNKWWKCWLKSCHCFADAFYILKWDHNWLIRYNLHDLSSSSIYSLAFLCHCRFWVLQKGCWLAVLIIVQD